MSLLDLVLGDRAGTYLLVSCLLVATLAIISAIIDIPLRALDDAGFVQTIRSRPLLSGPFARAVGIATLLLTFLGAATQAYLASSLLPTPGNTFALIASTNAAFFLAVATWGLTAPLARHWGLCLGAFGLGLAALFVLLAAVLQIPFSPVGALPSDWTRWLFSLTAGSILIALGACLASLLALGTYIARQALLLISEHRRHWDELTAEWQAARARSGRRRRSPPVTLLTPESLQREEGAPIPFPSEERSD